MSRRPGNPVRGTTADRADLEAAYLLCRQITKERAKNFYYAFITLPKDQRLAIYAAYAFCRHCDDATDEQSSPQEKLAKLEELRGEMERCFRGESSDALFLALFDAAERYRIPKAYLQELLNGVEMDLAVRRYETFPDLLDYCYKVASVVGLLCIEVFGYTDPRAKEHAVDLGTAMQLTNILRDLKEDAERERIYLPLEDLNRFGYSPEELEAEVMNDSFHQLMRFQVGRAREYFHRGHRLLPLLSPRARVCVAVLHGLYSRILDKIEARNYDVFTSRVSLSTAEKLRLTGRLWTQSFLQGPATPSSLSE